MEFKLSYPGSATQVRLLAPGRNTNPVAFNADAFYRLDIAEPLETAYLRIWEYHEHVFARWRRTAVHVWDADCLAMLR